MRTWTFEIEITRCAPEPVREFGTAGDADEADAMVRAHADVCFVMLTQRDGERYGDDFYVWFAGDRAVVRRDEHRERYAVDPAWAASAPDTVIEFREVEGAFSARAAETVSRSQALEALTYWLRTGEMLPALTWP